MHGTDDLFWRLLRLFEIYIRVYGTFWPYCPVGLDQFYKLLIMLNICGAFYLRNLIVSEISRHWRRGVLWSVIVVIKIINDRIFRVCLSIKMLNEIILKWWPFLPIFYNIRFCYHCIKKVIYLCDINASKRFFFDFILALNKLLKSRQPRISRHRHPCTYGQELFSLTTSITSNILRANPLLTINLDVL